jgi:BTB/POZ domain
LFVGTKKLETIDFSSNQLEFMSSKLFLPINQLKHVSFHDNKRISYFWDSGFSFGLESLEEMKVKIDELCIPPALATQRLPSGNFHHLWELKGFSDFTVVCGNKQFPVHKIVLAAQSPVFAAMFKNDEQVKSTKKLEIKDYSEELVEIFLKCLYAGEVSQEGSQKALKLFGLAKKFEVEQLKSELEEECISSLNDENAFDALAAGNRYKSEALIEAAYDQAKGMIIGGLERGVLKDKPDQLKHFMEVIKEHDPVVISDDDE